MPPVGDHAPARSTVVDMLRAHGLAGDCIAQLWALSRSMRRDSRRRHIEYAGMVDSETGQVVGGVMSGQEHGVDLRRHIAALVLDRRYAQFHTHPGSSSFSDADVAMLLSWEQIQAVVVVGVDGTWYALSRHGRPSVARMDAIQAFQVEFDRIEAEQPDLSIRERTRSVWNRIAGRLRLRNDRPQREEP